MTMFAFHMFKNLFCKIILFSLIFYFDGSVEIVVIETLDKIRYREWGNEDKKCKVVRSLVREEVGKTNALENKRMEQTERGRQKERKTETKRSN